MNISIRYFQRWCGHVSDFWAHSYNIYSTCISVHVIRDNAQNRKQAYVPVWSLEQGSTNADRKAGRQAIASKKVAVEFLDILHVPRNSTASAGGGQRGCPRLPGMLRHLSPTDSHLPASALGLSFVNTNRNYFPLRLIASALLGEDRRAPAPRSLRPPVPAGPRSHTCPLASERRSQQSLLLSQQDHSLLSQN